MARKKTKALADAGTPSYCLFNLTLGKAHRLYAPSAYRTCITNTQAKELFGTTAKPKPLGCGVFACVFAHKDPDKVVKITHDASDVAGLMLANTEGYGVSDAIPAPKLYAQYRLGSRAQWTNYKPAPYGVKSWPPRPQAFALVLERLRPLTGAEKSLWTQRLSKMRRENDPAKICPKKGAAACLRDVAALQKLRDDLGDRGVDWTDMHGGNIGRDKNGNWKALDLGASHTRLYEELPELAGGRRRRR